MNKFSTLFKLDQVLLGLGCKCLAAKRFPQYIVDENIRKKNEELKAKRSGNRCYILGLGPSLRKVDLRKLDGDIFATNGYVLTDESDRVEPDFYCLIDGAFYDASNNVMGAAQAAYPDVTFLLNGKFRETVESFSFAPANKHYFYMWAGPFVAKKAWTARN